MHSEIRLTAILYINWQVMTSGIPRTGLQELSMARAPALSDTLVILLLCLCLPSLALSSKLEMIRTEASQLFRVGEHSQVGKCISSEENATATITWYKNGVPLTPDKEDVIINERIKKNQDTNLTLVESTLRYRPNEGDGGSLIYCEASYSPEHFLKTQRSEAISLHLVVPLESVTIKVTPKKTELQEGDLVSLTCIADCNPKPEFQWYKDGTEIKYTDDGEMLKLAPISMADAGVYTCTALDEDFNYHSADVTIMVMNGPGEERFAEAGETKKLRSQNTVATVIGILGMLIVVTFILALLLYYSKNKEEKKALEKPEEGALVNKVEVLPAEEKEEWKQNGMEE